MHILVLLTRRQSFEWQGEDFLCARVKERITNSHNHSMSYQPPNRILLPD